VQGTPVTVGTGVTEGETEWGGGSEEWGNVGLHEAGEEEVACWLQARDEGGEVGQEDVAVDVGQEDVGLRSRGEAAGIAEGNLSLAAVEGVVVLGVAHAPFIDVVGEDMSGAKFQGCNAQNAGATTGIDDGGGSEGGEVGEQAQHQTCGGVLAAAKGLTGDDLQELAVGERDGLEVVLGFPGGIPVLIGGRGGSEGDAKALGNRNGEEGEGVGDGVMDGGLVVGVLQDVGGEAGVRGLEGVTTYIGQQGGQHICCRLVVGGDMEGEFQIFHGVGRHGGARCVGYFFSSFASAGLAFL